MSVRELLALHTVTDAVGGVDVTVDKTVKDERTHYVFKQGVNHLDGSSPRSTSGSATTCRARTTTESSGSSSSCTR
nr:LCP family protein [Fodinicola feengrottensis]